MTFGMYTVSHRTIPNIDELTFDAAMFIFQISQILTNFSSKFGKLICLWFFEENWLPSSKPFRLRWQRTHGQYGCTVRNDFVPDVHRKNLSARNKMISYFWCPYEIIPFRSRQSFLVFVRNRFLLQNLKKLGIMVIFINTIK